MSDTLNNDFMVKLWGGVYYAKMRMPDGTSLELGSRTDLTYAQWVTKFQTAWEQTQEPKPTGSYCPLENPDCPNYRVPFE